MDLHDLLSFISMCKAIEGTREAVPFIVRKYIINGGRNRSQAMEAMRKLNLSSSTFYRMVHQYETESESV